MIVAKTLKVKLLLTNEDIVLINESVKEFTRICNEVSKFIYENNFILNSKFLVTNLYQKFKNESILTTSMIQTTFRTVIDSYKKAKTFFKNRPKKYKNKGLKTLKKPIKFSNPQLRLRKKHDYYFLKNGSLSIATCRKRLQKVNYVDPGINFYIENGWKLGISYIQKINNKWYLYVPITKEIPDIIKENITKIVGIDRGLRFLAVTYDNNNYCKFYSGKNIIYKRTKFIEIRKNLQKKNTKSSKRVLKKLSGKEKRWIRNINHKITKEIVEKYGPNTLYVIEDLTNVNEVFNNIKSKTYRTLANRWAYDQFEKMLIYKAHLCESEVIKVTPKYTSQRCPKCGLINKDNRHHNTHEYICSSCGYRSNDDRIGAMNLYKLGCMWLDGIENPCFINK